ncbi:hypothetical protein AB9N12_19210 [Bacteroides sp. AN502(2024)]|uniref:hypothetical protein n=1 Tax=Bacteroides sp. AN502(2024) TaxID=3160599 RepID=UPI0035173A90
MEPVEVPGVTLAFPNGVCSHFGLGSESVLIDVLIKVSISSSTLTIALNVVPIAVLCMVPILRYRHKYNGLC